jgi:hypothetical protein
MILTVAKANAVVVTGSGFTKEEAINNGLREAVELYTGSLVYAVTDVENYQIKKDQIVATSLGHIKSYRIINISNIDNSILVTLDIKLAEEKIEEIVRENVKIITIDDVLKDYNNVYKRQEQMQKLSKMLNILSERPINEKYYVNYVGYEIVRISPTTVDTILTVKLCANPFFMRTYREVIKNLSEEKSTVDNFRVGTNYRFEFGKLVNDIYYISADPEVIDDIKVYVTVDGQKVDNKYYHLRDNLVVVFSTKELIKVFIKCFPKHFKQAYDGEEVNVDKKWNNIAIKKSKIIPEEGLPLKIKYRVTAEQIKTLANLKIDLQVKQR